MTAPEDTVHGRFPFGRPSTVRPMRSPKGEVQLLVVGVYPSAFHVAWSPPAHLDPRKPDERSRPFIGSLAVDVEPVVFWDGSDPSPADLLEQWQSAVRFDTELHGTVRAGTNGPSGADLVEHYLDPLGVDPSVVAYTDAVPWYFVKHGAGSQWAAMERYNQLAGGMGLPLADIPERPTRAELRAIVAGHRSESLREEIVASGAPRLMTLGQEALDAVRVIADDVDEAPETLVPADYGTPVNLVVGGVQMHWLPLVHPGFLRQTKADAWLEAVAAWKAR